MQKILLIFLKKADMKITIGGFDGMHLAHTELIKRSDAYLVIEKNSSLTPFFDRIEYDSRMLDLMILENIKHLSKDEFIDILKNYNIKEIIVGFDFKFGKNRSGGIDDLKKHFKVEVIKEIYFKNIPIHSNIIRNLLKNNDIKKANLLLGHNYKIKGVQIKGQGLGSEKFLPTINLELIHNYTLPQGVFLTKTNGFDSITFIGKRSTDENFAIETHILSSEFRVPSLKLINIEFLEFIRNNKKFDNLKELKKQILKDKQKALKILEECNT